MIPRIRTKQLLTIFRDINESKSESKICFIIGAGASFNSGIRTGADLSKLWFKEIERDFEQDDVLNWMEEKKIEKNNLPASYGKIYAKRFSIYPSLGFDFLNGEMENKEPSFGYTVLCQMLTETPHNVIITTNFDNLAEYALYIYSGKQPLTCGHESLAAYAKASVSRPLIIKIHRDLLLAPFNDDGEINKLQEAWKTPLNILFSDRILVFIGYGGNDGSLMGFLNEPINFKGIYWCTRKGSTLQPAVEAFLSKNKGMIAEIDGFDEFMFELHATMKFKRLDAAVTEVANKRSKAYMAKLLEITKQSSESKNPERKEAAKELTEKEKIKDDPWTYLLRASAAEKDNISKEKIYLQGLEKFPDHSSLNRAYADFLTDILKKHDEAEKYYKKALELDPDDEATNGNYANFLKNIRKDYDEAEKHYKKALEVEPNDATNNGNYAIFLKDIRKQYDEAEKYYRKALELDPNSAANNYNYAIFLNDIRKNYDGVEKYYKKALELDPDDEATNGNYAIFLKGIRKNYDEAEKYYKKALELDPNNAINNGNYAIFLKGIRKNYYEAEKYYRKALELDPNNAVYNSNYANFLVDIRKNYDEAEKFYKKGLELDPNNGNTNGSYASFLKDIRKNYDEAEKYYKKAIELDPNNSNYNCNYSGFLLSQGRKKEAIPYLDTAIKNRPGDDALLELQFYRYAHFPEFRIEAKQKIEEMLNQGIRSPGWNFDDNIEQAIKEGHPEPKELRRLADLITKT